MRNRLGHLLEQAARQGMGQIDTLPAWADDLSVDVDILDEDHQAFFRLAALMQDVTSAQDSDQGYIIETAINILKEYIEGHFLREEKALTEIDYPHLAEHIAEHDAFADQVARVIKEYRNTGEATTLVTLSHLVAEWLTGHIQTMDSQFKGLLTNANVDDRPLVYMAAGVDAELAP